MYSIDDDIRVISMVVMIPNVIIFLIDFLEGL